MLSTMRIFVKVAESGSFSKAGAILVISPSAVSRQINRLEDDLGVQLFKRSTRHVVLTAAGEVLFGRVQRGLADIDDACGEMRALNAQAPRGDVRISVFETFGRLHVCPILPAFLKRHPDVRIEVILDNNLANLYQDDIDIAIRIGMPKDSSLKARKLNRTRMLVCASPDYLAANGSPAAPQDLAAHNCLALNRGRQLTWWHFRSEDGYQKIQVDGNLSSAGGTPLLEGARQGIGITLLADWMVADSLRSGEVVSILDAWQAELHEGGSGDVYAVFVNDPHMKPAMRVFIDYLCESVSTRC